MDGRLRILLVEPALGDNGALRSSLERAARWSVTSEVTLLVVDRQRNEVGVPTTIRTVVANEKCLRRRILEGRRVQRLFGRTGVTAAADRVLEELSVVVRLVVGVVRGVTLARHVDVVVAGREIESGLLVGAMASRITRRPFAVTARSNFDAALSHHVPHHYHRVTRWATKQADVIACISSGLPDTYRSLRLPRTRFEIVRSGLDATAIRSQASQQPSLALGDWPVLVAVGRLGQAKGFDILIRAHAAALTAGSPRHEVWIVGRGPLHQELVDLAVNLGVGDSVRMTGFLTNPHSVVARSEGFVLSSRWEGLPRVLVEALVLGVPCIATDCASGPREVLEDGRWGQLVEPDDFEDLAAAIVEHLRDPTDLRRRAQLGMDRAAERFDADVAARRHLELLRTTVRSGGYKTGVTP